MNDVTLGRKIRRDQTGVPVERRFKKTNREPTVEEFVERAKALTNLEMKKILQRAGILDRDGNLTEIYRPL